MIIVSNWGSRRYRRKMYGKVPGKPLFAVTRLILYPRQRGLFIISGLKSRLVGEKEAVGELVPALLPLDLEPHQAPEILLVDIA